MRIIRHPVKKQLQGAVVALGTFDGVHRGHQRVIAAAVRRAKQLGVASLAITFDPHPQQVIAPERGLKLLTTLKEREELFCTLGVDGVVVFQFNQRLRRLSAAAFIAKYLAEKLGVKEVFVGFDYAFGQGRSGGVIELKRLGRRFGFKVTVMPALKIGSQIVKSRLIRELVSSGEFNRAVKLLGHAYQITGKVVKGRGTGAKLGFPTANLAIAPEKLIPARGVYAGRFGKYKCAINIGGRPTFGGGKTILETHIFDFNKNICDKIIELDLDKYLREERQFADVAKLVKQIQRDIVKIKRGG